MISMECILSSIDSLFNQPYFLLKSLKSLIILHYREVSHTKNNLEIPIQNQRKWQNIEKDFKISNCRQIYL